MGVSIPHLLFPESFHSIQAKSALKRMSSYGLTAYSGVCRKFNDGFPNVFVKDATRIRNRHVAFLASFQDAATIFEQLSVIYQLPRMFVGSFTLVLPYFPTGTAERVRSLLHVASMGRQSLFPLGLRFTQRGVLLGSYNQCIAFVFAG